MDDERVPHEDLFNVKQQIVFPRTTHLREDHHRGGHGQTRFIQRTLPKSPLEPSSGIDEYLVLRGDRRRWKMGSGTLRRVSKRRISGVHETADRR